jgi:hypothetical protein
MVFDREEGGLVPFDPPTRIIQACHVRSAALPSARMAPDTSVIRLEQDGLRANCSGCPCVRSAF